MRENLNRRDFLKISGAIPLAFLRLPNIDLRKQKEMAPLKNGADLDLTHFWDDNVYLLKPDQGRVRIRACLFIGKGTIYNYDLWKNSKVVLPRNVSLLQWNSSEAIHEWGARILQPGDEIAFTESVDPYDELIPKEYGDKGEQGDGYVNFGNGICNASTTLGEAFGTEIKVNGTFVPLFIARPGSIQPHNLAHNPEYYDYAYNGLGIGVAPTIDAGHLPFMVNPNLPPTTIVSLGLEAIDTEPTKKRAGIYKPTVTLEVSGLPNGTQVRYQRTTANRETIVTRVIGAKDYIVSYAKSVYFDKDGNPIISNTPITPPNSFNPQSLVEVTSPMETIFRSYLASSRAPDSAFNEAMFPGGFARPGKHLNEGGVIWEKTNDISLPIHPDDIPPPMKSKNDQELLRILSWNNVEDPRNQRYKSNAITGPIDWAREYRLSDYPFSVPLPRWMTMREQKLTTSDLYDWLNTEEAALLGWQSIEDHQIAQSLANEGNFVPVVARGKTGYQSHIAIIAPGEGKTIKDVFYPNVADSLWGFGPQKGKTVHDSFSFTFNENYLPPTCFVWIPPKL